MSSKTSVSSRSASQKPFAVLFLAFTIWKLLILSIAYFSPGIGYDTSTSLLDAASNYHGPFANVPDSFTSPLLKLVRWDGIYFTRISQRGHIFEQEWAFGKGVSTVLASAVQSLTSGTDNDVVSYAMAGVVLSHLAHWGSVTALYQTAKILQEPLDSGSNTIPFIAAALHIATPGGIFLSSPNAEGLFSFLNMLGFYLYARSMNRTRQNATATDLMYKLAAGVVFGLATTVRSNGILSGIPFFLDAIETMAALANPQVDLFTKSPLLLQLQLTIVAGCCIALGMALPQFLAYREYCIDGPGGQPWCKSWFPSIYSYVQSHYWNVGFLRYWTLPNLPLFLLATPCLYLLFVSGVDGIRPSSSTNSGAPNLQKLRLRIALPQLVLPILAFTSYHVQIITRQASGYPFWYIWLATRIESWKYWSLTIRVLLIYGLFQAGLYASFLPPA